MQVAAAYGRTVGGFAGTLNLLLASENVALPASWSPLISGSVEVLAPPCAPVPTPADETFAASGHPRRMAYV